MDDTQTNTTTTDTTAAATNSTSARRGPTCAASHPLRATLYVIAFFQFALGAAFLVAPGATAEMFGLPPAPGWTGWLFAMMAARFLGYGWGMIVAARDPVRHRAWIDTMIAIQAIDWLSTIGHLASGDVTMRNVMSASFMPLLFAIALTVLRPRRATVRGS